MNVSNSYTYDSSRAQDPVAKTEETKPQALLKLAEIAEKAIPKKKDSLEDLSKKEITIINRAMRLRMEIEQEKKDIELGYLD